MSRALSQEDLGLLEQMHQQGGRLAFRMVDRGTAPIDSSMPASRHREP